MPSPFAKYQGEQVAPINYLPAIAQMSESLRKGIADLGEGAGAYLESAARAC